MDTPVESGVPTTMGDCGVPVGGVVMNTKKVVDFQQQTYMDTPVESGVPTTMGDCSVAVGEWW